MREPPRPQAARIERATRELSRALIEHATADDVPWVPDAAWFDERMLDFFMEHPKLKVELFRFIDVLPCLPPGDVSGHLLEYLGGARSELPSPLRFSMELTAPGGTLGKIVSRAARRNVLRMARKFIAGATVGEVVGAIRAMRRRRLAVTLDALGEAVLTDREADAYVEQYVVLLREAARAVGRFPEEPLTDRDHDGTPLPRVNVSVKLSALTPIFDPLDPDGVARSVVPRFRRILDAAFEVGGFVHVDMEQYERKDLTLSLFEDVLGSPRYAKRTNVGVVVQAYLRDAEHDIERLSAWARRRGAPIWIRLVKGAYWDYETVIARQRGWPCPVFQEKWETDASYERCVDLLVERAGSLRPAFASHNPRSLGRGLAAAREAKLPERYVEFQALYGMADALKLALTKFHQRVRVYTPFGELIPGMAYLVRRLLENTSNESFVRNERLDDAALTRAIAKPEPTAHGPRATEIRDQEPSMTHDQTEARLKSFENEPLRDFSRSEVRSAFKAALDRALSDAGTHCPVVIAGHEMETAERILSVSPSDSKRVVAASASATEEHADLAVAAAQEAFAGWRAVPMEERAAVLDKAADIMASRRDELAAWTCIEAGKPWRDADADIAEAIDFCRYYALVARTFATPERHDVPGESNATVLVPRGPTVVISPWNFPIAILTGMAAAPLVTGNPVILKPAEQTPACGYHVFQIFREAGVPEGVVHFLPGKGEVVGARLVAHPDVATIAFTGSREVGGLIARRAAETSTGVVGLKRVIAEMGGKNAIVVDDDADLDEAVPGVLASAFGYAGQKCSACSRVIAVGRVYEPFVERLAAAAKTLIAGSAEDPSASIGPLIDAESVARVRRYVELAERDGEVLFRGELPRGTERGYFAAPVIVGGVSADHALAQEEIFGPVLLVLRAKDVDEAFAIANGTAYALTGGIYSRSPAHIERARLSFDVGNLYINRKITGAQVSRHPFGGHRGSGTGGKAGGRDYLLHFGNLRAISENTLRRGFAKD
ncbi:MAG TPA: proline dehydrogenase family protein [Polyangiaceae bacterium]|nr:proline dehydrogenase family protein [Polyangiaceae bacterium]